jgi:hypothetical protein
MGAYKAKILAVLELYKEGRIPEEIAESMGIPLSEVIDILKNYS